jgi:hypothetical protein
MELKNKGVGLARTMHTYDVQSLQLGLSMPSCSSSTLTNK